MSQYPHLLSALDLGFTTLPNLVIMRSMHTAWRNTRAASSASAAPA